MLPRSIGGATRPTTSTWRTHPASNASGNGCPCASRAASSELVGSMWVTRFALTFFEDFSCHLREPFGGGGNTRLVERFPGLHIGLGRTPQNPRLCSVSPIHSANTRPAADPKSVDEIGLAAPPAAASVAGDSASGPLDGGHARRTQRTIDSPPIRRVVRRIEM